MFQKFAVRAALLSSVLAGAALADVSQTDVEVGGRVLGFLATPISGETKLSVVYAPANPASTVDEKALIGLLGTGFKAGNVTFQPTPVELDKIDSVAGGVIFLTGGLGADGAKVAAMLKAKKLICITTDLAAVQAGYCAIHLKAVPKVQITVNKALADQLGISFGAAFKLMITEI
jgi:hypothetical protein